MPAGSFATNRPKVSRVASERKGRFANCHLRVYGRGDNGRLSLDAPTRFPSSSNGESVRDREMGPLFFQLSTGTQVRRQTVMERRRKKTGIDRGRNRPRQISGREFVTSVFRARVTRSAFAFTRFPRGAEKTPSRRNAVRMEEDMEERWKERNDFSLILRIQRPEAKTVVDRSFPGWR